MQLTHTTHAGQAVALYFRGALNLAAVLDSLVSTYGLGAATELVLSGDSAGGLATYHHVDYIAARLPGARVVGAPDSGARASGFATGLDRSTCLRRAASHAPPTPPSNRRLLLQLPKLPVVAQHAEGVRVAPQRRRRTGRVGARDCVHTSRTAALPTAPECS